MRHGRSLAHFPHWLDSLPRFCDFPMFRVQVDGKHQRARPSEPCRFIFKPVIRNVLLISSNKQRYWLV